MPPAYPFLLAELGRLDSKLAQGLDCAHGLPLPGEFASSFQTLRVLQGIAAVGILILVYHLSETLTGVRSTAMATVVLYVIGGKLGEFARSVQPDSFRNFATFLSLLLLAVALRRNRAWMFAAAGACLGAAALFYPILAILIVVAPAALGIALPLSAGASWRSTAQNMALFALGGGAVIAPWCLRNWMLFGDPMLADRSEALLLSLRAAYNAMPYSDWPLAVLSWVPSYGNVLTNVFAGAGAANPFALSGPGTYFSDGPAIFAHGLAQTPATANPFVSIWQTHVAADPVRHLATSIPIFTRGMWGTHGFMGIVGLFLLPRMLRHLSAGPNGAAGIAVAVFAFLLVLVQSMLAPNLYWMNTPMLLLMALAIAGVLPHVAAWIDQKAGEWTSRGRRAFAPAGAHAH